jgi:hypothetical protein
MTRHQTSRRTKALAVLQLALVGPMLWASIVVKSTPWTMATSGALAVVALTFAWSALRDLKQLNAPGQTGQTRS